MEFYRAYNVNATGKTLGFKDFPSMSDRDACTHALTIQADGKWHTVDLWTGLHAVDCSDLSDRGKGRRVSLPAV